jgi:hypothetical protein
MMTTRCNINLVPEKSVKSNQGLDQSCVIRSEIAVDP